MPRTRRTLHRVVGAAAAVGLLAAGGTATFASSGDEPDDVAATIGTTTPVHPIGGASTAAPPPIFTTPRTIDNRYLPLTAFGRCEFRGEDHDGSRTRSVKTLLTRTQRFDVGGQRVDAAVFRDDVWKNGKRIETAYDYFAQADDGTVYYLGEDVTNVGAGGAIDHAGSWRYGRDTDVPGVAMPAAPTLGVQWHFEDVPGVTTESNRVEEVGLRAEAGRTRYTGVIRVQEFTQPDGEVEYKLYAPGVGLITEYPPDGRAERVGCR